MQHATDPMLDAFCAAADELTESDDALTQSDGAPTQCEADAEACGAAAAGTGQAARAGGAAPAPAPAPAYVAPPVGQTIASVHADNYVMVALRPVLERMGLLESLEAHVGTAKLDNLQIRQQIGGPYHGKFVAHDPVVLLSKVNASNKGTLSGNANKLVKRIVGPAEEDRKVKGFMSREYVDAGNSNVSLLKICTE